MTAASLPSRVPVFIDDATGVEVITPTVLEEIVEGPLPLVPPFPPSGRVLAPLPPGPPGAVRAAVNGCPSTAPNTFTPVPLAPSVPVRGAPLTLYAPWPATGVLERHCQIRAEGAGEREGDLLDGTARSN